MPQPNVNSDIKKLDSQRAKFMRKQAEIINEQNRLISTANKGIEKINADLADLKPRLEKYTDDKRTKKFDDNYHTMKDRYTQGLKSRTSLENAVSVAEESISAAQLQRIPGEES